MTGQQPVDIRQLADARFFRVRGFKQAAPGFVPELMNASLFGCVWAQVEQKFFTQPGNYL